MKRFLVVFCGLLLFLFVSLGAEIKVAYITSRGGLGDLSWNDIGFAGVTKAAQDFGITVRVVESPDPVGMGEKLLRDAARAGFNIVITMEYAHLTVLPTVAADFPNTLFVMLNYVIEASNVASIVFYEHEGSFLAGALAAMVVGNNSIPGISGKKIIGVIGGTKSLGIDKFVVGYKEGAQYIDPEVQVLVAYSETFSDPAKGRELALAMFNAGADVVYQVAGATGMGVIQAAKETGKYAIGVDTDQDYIAPEHVLTSVLKRADIALYLVIKDYVEGRHPGGKVYHMNLKNNGVGLSEMKYTRHLIPADYITKLEEIKKKILTEEIKVTDVTGLSKPYSEIDP
ncbi:MAG: BMP family lipoprotein [Candidatus Hadarchaeum sp.]|uniref:BMP family lipoprotein n=1 Tax=Candidatus Hadarchaeum sp. TaxID=2883567 RepID=UPI003D0F4698